MSFRLELKGDNSVVARLYLNSIEVGLVDCSLLDAGSVGRTNGMQERSGAVHTGVGSRMMDRLNVATRQSLEPR